MKIKLDEKHYLNSDAYCYYITAIVESKDGKAYERRVSGYVATLNDVVGSYIEKSVMSSQAAEIVQLRNEIEVLKSEVRGWVIENEKICRQDKGV